MGVIFFLNCHRVANVTLPPVEDRVAECKGRRAFTKPQGANKSTKDYWLISSDSEEKSRNLLVLFLEFNLEQREAESLSLISNFGCNRVQYLIEF